MSRVILIFGLVISGVFGQLSTLGPGRDLNEAVNLGHFVLIKWMGNADNHIVGIDVAKNRLILAEYANLNRGWLPQEITVLGTLRENVSRDAFLVLADTDDDGREDVVLLEGDNAYSWTSTGRFASGPWSSPIHIPLPVSLVAPGIGNFLRPNPPEVHDLDGDGRDDLLIQPQMTATDHAAGGVIFSFGKEDAEWVPFPQSNINGVFVGPAWENSLVPTVVITAVTSEQIPGDFVSGFKQSRSLHYYSASRSLVEIHDVHSPPFGVLVNLLGESKAQIVNVERDPQDDRYVIATIHRHTSSGWEVARTFRARHYLERPWTVSVTDLLVADMDGSRGDEVHFVIENWNHEAELWNVSSPVSYGDPSLVRVGSVPGNIVSIRKHRNLEGYYPSAFLGIVRKSSASLASRGTFFQEGNGTRASLMKAPLTYRDEVPFFGQKALSDTVIGELNGDGIPDIVALRRDALAIPFFSPAYGAGEVFGNPPAYFPNPASILLEDDNGDGLDDPLFVSPSEVRSFRTTALPGQSPAFPFLASSSPFDWMVSHRALGTGDFDGDGDEDLLFLHGYHETLAWSENLGGGSYGTARHIALAGRVHSMNYFPGYEMVGKNQVQIGDFDQDGDVDIITCPSSLGNRVALHRNNGGAFTVEPLTPFIGELPGQRVATYPTQLSTVKVGRFFPNDPSVQFALCAEMVDENSGDYNSGVWLVKLTPDGPVISPEPISFGRQNCVEFTVADFNGDGLDDLIGARSGIDRMGFAFEPIPTGILCRLNQGDGTFGALRDLGPTIGFATGIDARDFDGDGRCDVLVTSTHTDTIELFRHQEIPAPSAYREWALSHGLSPDDINGDDDHDGIGNLIEYAAGTSPSARSILSQSMFMDVPYDSLITLEQTRPSLPSGVSVEIDAEYSTDLFEWHAFPRKPEVIVNSSDPEREILRWEISRWDDEAALLRPKMFFRYHFRRPSGD